MERIHTKLQMAVSELRDQGKCSVEISEILGKPAHQIKAVANHIGKPFSDEEKQRSLQLGKNRAVLIQHGSDGERIQKQIDFLADYHPRFEYVSGWLAGEGMMQLQCKACGNFIEKSAESVRRKHRNIICQFCKEQDQKRKMEEKEQEKERQKRKKEDQKQIAFWEQSFTQEAVSFCPVCNSVFWGNKKYCSDSCYRKVSNAIGKDRRIKKMRRSIVDKDIEIHSLYNRDNGKCWICGEQCDFDDYEIINGAFVVGSSYPSIDHVFPLSRGGLHSWDNVKLAHHYCNTIKSNKVVSL